MTVIMKDGATKKQVDAVLEQIKGSGLRAAVMKGEFKTVIGLIGDESKANFDALRIMSGVEDVMRIQSPYKLMTRQHNLADNMVVKMNGVEIGNKRDLVFIAGPCSIESYDQLSRIAGKVKSVGADMLRGGAFKPRTSVHSFQGLGEEGLKILMRVGKEQGMPTVTEVLSEKDVEMVAAYADMLQIGARNMQNQSLLEEAARSGKPIFFKRGPGAQIGEYLSYAERIVAAGNKKLVLCERGIIPLGGSFKSQTRNTLDVSAVPVINAETPFPVFVDPSHGTGRKDLIYPMSMAAIAAGADGLMIEVHDKPEEALSDGAQALSQKELERIIVKGKKLHALMRS